jgi:uncharacterized protein YggU (UPF0235/DUF167 family)
VFRSLLAERLGVGIRSVSLVAGASSPAKTFAVLGIGTEFSAEAICAKLK